MEPLKHGYSVNDAVAAGIVSTEEVAHVRGILKQVMVPQLTDEQILQFIISCDHDLEFTVITIREYYAARKNGPDLFNNRSLDSPENIQQLNVVRCCVFPTRTKDGCAILFHSLKDTIYCHYQMETAMKLVFMLIDSAIYEAPTTGLVILFDMKGVSLMHLTRMKIGAVRKFCHYVQEALPVKLKEIHVINSAYFIDKVMLILKPFLKKELLNQLHFHLPTDEENYYEKLLPKDCLPRDLGGELPSIDDLHDAQVEKFRVMDTFFSTEEQIRQNYFNNEKH